MATESQHQYIMRMHRVLFKHKRHEIARLSGVPLDTLNKIFQGRTKNPKASTVQAIFDVLQGAEKKAKRAGAKPPEAAKRKPRRTVPAFVDAPTSTL